MSALVPQMLQGFGEWTALHVSECHTHFFYVDLSLWDTYSHQTCLVPSLVYDPVCVRVCVRVFAHVPLSSGMCVSATTSARAWVCALGPEMCV